MTTPIDLLSTAALVHVDVLLHWAVSENKSLEQVSFEVQEQLEKRSAVMIADMSAAVKNYSQPCPTPGCTGQLERWPLHSALAQCSIVGCARCHHSEVDRRGV